MEIKNIKASDYRKKLRDVIDDARKNGTIYHVTNFNRVVLVSMSVDQYESLLRDTNNKSQ